MGPDLIALVPFRVPDDIESCNFKNLLVFGFPETSQNLMSLRQLLFSLFHGGFKGKNMKTPEICQIGTEAIKPGPTMIRPFCLSSDLRGKQSKGRGKSVMNWNKNSRKLSLFTF